MPSGGQNRIDLTGQRFGKLVAIRCTGSNNRQRATWLCQCDCGNEYTTTCFNLRQGRNRSCGCQNYHLYGSSNPKWSGYGDVSGSYWHRIKQGARNRNLELAITIESIWALFIKQGKKCALSGMNLTMCSSDTKIRKDLKLQTASLDRIDSSKGYISGNIQWVHKDINAIKMDLNTNYFIELCKKVANYNE